MPSIDLNARLERIADAHSSIGARLLSLTGAHSSIVDPIASLGPYGRCPAGRCFVCDDRYGAYSFPIARVVQLGRIRVAIRFIRALAARARAIFRLGGPSNRA